MSQTSTTRAKRGSWILRIAIGSLVLIATCGIVLVATVSFGNVYGIEFNPETFERRAFQYLEVPLLRWQVRKVKRTDMTGDTEEFLATNKYVPQQPKGSEVWHIVQAQHGRHAWQGDAQILINYFEAQNSDDNPVWLEWSKAHPKLAAILWPAISQLAVNELYIYIPEVIELAKGAQDPSAFKKEMNARLAATFYEAGIRCQKAGNHEAAITYLDQAVALAPENNEYAKARDASKKAGA